MSGLWSVGIVEFILMGRVSQGVGPKECVSKLDLHLLVYSGGVWRRALDALVGWGGVSLKVGTTDVANRLAAEYVVSRITGS